MDTAQVAITEAAITADSDALNKALRDFQEKYKGVAALVQHRSQEGTFGVIAMVDADKLQAT